jgi:hypothetical protein
MHQINFEVHGAFMSVLPTLSMLLIEGIIEWLCGTEVGFILLYFFVFILFEYFTGATSGVLVAGISGVLGTTAYYLSSPTTITFDSTGFM